MQFVLHTRLIISLGPLHGTLYEQLLQRLFNLR
jgi:hypothetical protein